MAESMGRSAGFMRLSLLRNAHQFSGHCSNLLPTDIDLPSIRPMVRPRFGDPEGGAARAKGNCGASPSRMLGPALNNLAQVFGVSGPVDRALPVRADFDRVCSEDACRRRCSVSRLRSSWRCWRRWSVLFSSTGAAIARARDPGQPSDWARLSRYRVHRSPPAAHSDLDPARDRARPAEEEGENVRARALRVEFALGALVRGEWRIADARLEEPQFAAGLDASGTLGLAVSASRFRS